MIRGRDAQCRDRIWGVELCMIHVAEHVDWSLQQHNVRIICGRQSSYRDCYLRLLSAHADRDGATLDECRHCNSDTRSSSSAGGIYGAVSSSTGWRDPWSRFKLPECIIAGMLHHLGLAVIA